jgi:hypothetical protein
MDLMSSFLYNLTHVGEFVWWIARVKVDENYQRMGYGKDLVTTLASLRKGHVMVVAPGGYSTPQEVQEAFYLSCGFIRQGDYMLFGV